MEEEKNSLDKFGKFLMENLRDNAVESFEMFAENKHKSPASQSMQNAFSKIAKDNIDIIKSIFISCLDTGIHDFLFALQEKCDSVENDIVVLVDNVNIAEESDGLQGELFTEDGWFNQYSKYGELEG